MNNPSNLPPGVTNADIEAQANGPRNIECPVCEGAGYVWTTSEDQMEEYMTVCGKCNGDAVIRNPEH